jgi:hypothetical protein
MQRGGRQRQQRDRPSPQRHHCAVRLGWWTMQTLPASHVRITSSSRRQQTRRRDSSSARLTVTAAASPAPALAGVACRGARRRGDDTQTETSHAASSSAAPATAHTHRSRRSAGRSRRGRSRRSGTCLRQQQGSATPHVTTQMRQRRTGRSDHSPRRDLLPELPPEQRPASHTTATHAQ